MKRTVLIKTLTNIAFPLLFLFLISNISTANAQPRVNFHQREIFLSGSNVAWVNFARDVGPDATNLTAFRAIFDSVHAHNGNVMRLWLHTTGASSPAFNGSGMVTGPGTNTIADIKAILDLAWERKIGLMLCLWSFDMLRISNGTGITDRAKLMLNDTAYTNAYIRTALIPIVTALKGHPGIQSWEIFNEPEGMSNEFGWSFNHHVPMYNIQRFVNLTTGAIHRTDPSIPVTNGSWSFMAQTDVPTVQRDLNIIRSKIRKEFKLHYGGDIDMDSLISKVSAVQNINYYRDDRLIAAGGDTLGTLDFYCVHYYDWAGTSLSPFHYPYSFWALDKPLVVAEFYVNDTFGKPYKDLYTILHSTGYAGAMSWSWTDQAVNAVQQKRTKEVMDTLFFQYPWDLDVDPVTGTIYSFTASNRLVEEDDSVVLQWKSSKGTLLTLNGESVNYFGTRTLAPKLTTTYILRSTGVKPESSSVTVSVHPAGTIVSFTASPLMIAAGESSILRWNTAKGSMTFLDGKAVKNDDSLSVSPTVNTTYTLIATGTVIDTEKVTVMIASEEQINRALKKSLTVSSNDQSDITSLPGNIVDGNLLSRWTSDVFEAQNIVVDLGSILNIKKIVLRWTSNYAKIYRIAYSTDNQSWSLAKAQSSGGGGTETHEGFTLAGQFVKILLDKTAVGGRYGLYELEVYGSSGPAAVAEEMMEQSPRDFALFQNFPNPFNPSTVIGYRIPADGKVELTVFDMLGKEVARLVDRHQNAGTYTVRFDGSNKSGGVYLCRLQSGGRTEIRKMILMK